MAPDALSALAKIGIETSLRYAMQLLMTSHLIAAKRKSATVELRDLERAFKLFLDQNRSVQFLQENESEFVSGHEWDNVNGGDEAAPMQDVQA